MKRFIFLWFLAICMIGEATSQSYKIINKLNRSDITNASITIQAEDPKDWKGAESIDLYVIVENKSNKSIQLGAKKIEPQALSSEIDHTFCFAGNCYNKNTFVSPINATLLAGKSDSSFLAHFLYDNTIHTRGIYTVKYVFFDTLNLSDSVFVEVKYNSVFKTSALSTPNIMPPYEWINNTLKFMDGMSHNIELFNSCGTSVYSKKQDVVFNLPIETTGLYFLKIDQNFTERIFIDFHY